MKQAKKQVEPTNYEMQNPYSAPSNTTYGDYLSPNTTPSFKKQTNYSPQKSAQYTEFTSNYSSPPSTSNFSSFSNNNLTPVKVDPPKRMKKDDF